ncbi:MAG: hypothetical protein JWM96_253 [Alphaproteobacteria bacterium]|nr:hypothetical protein [Alphaproteobacteria bacterium]
MSRLSTFLGVLGVTTIASCGTQRQVLSAKHPADPKAPTGYLHRHEVEIAQQENVLNKGFTVHNKDFVETKVAYYEGRQKITVGMDFSDSAIYLFDVEARGPGTLPDVRALYLGKPQEQDTSVQKLFQKAGEALQHSNLNKKRRPDPHFSRDMATNNLVMKDYLSPLKHVDYWLNLKNELSMKSPAAVAPPPAKKIPPQYLENFPKRIGNLRKIQANSEKNSPAN